MSQRLKNNIAYKVMYRNSTVEALKMYPIFSGLHREALNDVVSNLVEISLETGDDIFWLVNEPNCLIYI